MDKIFVVKNACPLCGSDVYGNDNLKYYCKRCDILFRKESLRILKEEFVGSKGSMKFHSLNCTSVKKLLDHNKVFFKTKEDALKQGFKPCNLCLKGKEEKIKKEELKN
ncbi:MAG: Ada metal-binding domain-containing protein [Candidatus Woesearchaeota archaeon]